MIIDAALLFSNAQTFTTGSENGVLSTSSVDLGVARNIGVGEDLYIVVTVATTQVATSNDVTYVDLVTDDAATLASPTVVQRLFTIPANSVAGTQLVARVPIGTYERYIGLLYTSYDHAQTAGALSAALVKEAQLYTPYAQSAGSAIATS
jgi:hypothetical protein